MSKYPMGKYISSPKKKEGEYNLFFKNQLVEIFKDENIDIISQSFDFSKCIFVTHADPSEQNEIKRNIILLVQYLLVSNRLITAGFCNGGKIYATGLSYKLDETYTPVELNRRIGVVPYSEPIWFNMVKSSRYSKITETNAYMSIFCKKIYNVSVDQKLLLFVNFSGDTTNGCLAPDEKIPYNNSLNKQLQNLINRCILVYIVRNFCGALSYSSYPQPLSYDDIISNVDAPEFNITNHIRGFEHVPISGNIKGVIDAFSSITGTRESYFTTDRIFNNMFSELLMTINALINETMRIIGGGLNDPLVAFYQGNIDVNNCEILGWVADDCILNTCDNFMPAEVSLPLRLLQREYRNNYFYNDKDCGPTFYRWNGKKRVWNGEKWNDVQEPPIEIPRFELPPAGLNQPISKKHLKMIPPELRGGKPKSFFEDINEGRDDGLVDFICKTYGVTIVNNYFIIPKQGRQSRKSKSRSKTLQTKPVLSVEVYGKKNKRKTKRKVG
jgi:hypothetical protein